MMTLKNKNKIEKSAKKLISLAKRLMPSPLAGLKWAIPVGLLAYIYYPTFAWMAERWMAKDSYYGHGFLIPLVSLYWIAQKYLKGALTLPSAGKQAKGNTRFNTAGLAVVLLAGIVQIMACALRFYFLSAMSLVILLLGGVIFIWGPRILRAVWFPVAFLSLMIPLPLLVISQITLKMKFWIAEIATHLIRATHIQAVREGSYIYTPHSVLLVGDPCSGLRSLMAFLCLGIIFAYDEKLAIWKRTVLVAAGLPLAFISNVARVYFLGLVGEVYGMEHTGPGSFPHDASGIVVFGFAFLAFLAIRRKLVDLRV